MLWVTVNGCPVSNHSYYVCNVKLSREEVEETHMRKYIGFATLNKAKTCVRGCLISFRLMWLRACVRLWLHLGARITPCGYNYFDIICTRTYKALTTATTEMV